MTQRARLQRPSLERTAPIRNLGKAFHKATETPTPKRPDDSAADVGNHGLEDAVAEGVRLGYSVIEDQIRQAQGLASKMNPSGNGLLNGGLSGSDDEIRSLLNRLLRTYGDLTNVWIQVLNAALGNAEILNAILGKDGVKPNGSASSSTKSRPEAKPSAGSGAIAFSVTASGPVETTVQFFDSGLKGTSLTVQDLRSRERDAPPLDDMRLTKAAKGEPVRISVNVPKEQPPGLYQGLILDQRTDASVGVLAIRVGSP